MVISFVKVYYCIACAEGPALVACVNCVLDFQFSELLSSWFAYPWASEKTKILVYYMLINTLFSYEMY